MDLCTALEVRRGERVAFTGGGGKTGLAHRLMLEGRERGWTALFTTTTKLLSSDGHDFSVVVTQEPLPDVLRDQLRQAGGLVLVRQWLDEWDEAPAGPVQKVGGFDASQVERLAEGLSPDLLLVEADGSRHRPFKAPAPYEPVVPASTTLLVIVAGLSVLGRPLAAEWVHRPERAAELAGVSLGTVVDPHLVAAVLTHPQGGVKGAPAGARVVVVLAQATEERRPLGRELARRLLAGGPFERVVLADLDRPEGDAELWRREGSGEAAVDAVVLAAGGAQRMGCNKLLLSLAGKPVVAHAVDAALRSRVRQVWVVLGADAEAVRAALGSRPVRFVYNRRWSEGLSASVREAVAVVGQQAEGILFLAGDMVWMPATHLDRLLEQFAPPRAVVWSGDGEVRGTPALFGRAAFSALAALQGDVGGRALVGCLGEEAVVPVSSSQFLGDLDTPAAYERARQRMEGTDR